jgi:hypothetical protein
VSSELLSPCLCVKRFPEGELIQIAVDHTLYTILEDFDIEIDQKAQSIVSQTQIGQSLGYGTG